MALAELERANSGRFARLFSGLELGSQSLRPALDTALSNAIKLVAVAETHTWRGSIDDSAIGRATEFLATQFFAESAARRGEIYTPWQITSLDQPS